MTTAIEERGRASSTAPGHLSEVIDEAATTLGLIQQRSLSGSDTSRTASTLQGTLLADAARFLDELRSDRPALSLP